MSELEELVDGVSRAVIRFTSPIDTLDTNVVQRFWNLMGHLEGFARDPGNTTSPGEFLRHHLGVYQALGSAANIEDNEDYQAGVLAFEQMIDLYKPKEINRRVIETLPDSVGYIDLHEYTKPLPAEVCPLEETPIVSIDEAASEANIETDVLISYLQDKRVPVSAHSQVRVNELCTLLYMRSTFHVQGRGLYVALFQLAYDGIVPFPEGVTHQSSKKEMSPRQVGNLLASFPNSNTTADHIKYALEQQDIEGQPNQKREAFSYARLLMEQSGMEEQGQQLYDFLRYEHHAKSTTPFLDLPSRLHRGSSGARHSIPLATSRWSKLPVDYVKNLGASYQILNDSKIRLDLLKGILAANPFEYAQRSAERLESRL